MIAVMGIDPGVEGGISVLRPDGDVAWTKPIHAAMTRLELRQLVREAFTALNRFDFSRVCYIEKVGYMGRRADGRKGDGGQGAFTFGRIAGMLEMGAAMAGCDVVDVPPMIWQTALKCLTGGDKNVTKRAAGKLWPNIKWTHNIADSALIARYGWERLRL